MSDWDRQTTPAGVEGPQWVSAAEAADVAGVTPGTVRYWARNGLIVSEVVEGPAGERTLVRLDEVLQHARQDAPSRDRSSPSAPPAPGRGPQADVVTELPARTSELAPILKSVPEIMAQLTAATDRAARAETKVEFLSAQLADLRRRLAEAEAGRDAGPSVTIPEAWETPPDAAAEVRDEPAAAEPAPGAAGWPAPPPGALVDEPIEEAAEGPATVDWTSREAGPAPETFASPVEEPAERAPEPAAISLDDIWNEPARPRERPPAQEPATPQPSGVDRRAAAEPSGVEWHDPGARVAEPPATDEPPPVARPANAPVPQGDDFYGPRRRRWFRRRR